MQDATLAIAILWVFLFTYSILGSVDFGAGFWSMLFGLARHTRVGSIANHFLSPSWEVTNVFLVLLVVALVGFFPRAAYMLGTALLVPVCIVLLLLLVRSSFMIFAYTSEGYEQPLRLISGLTGLLIPGVLACVLPITLGGFIEIRGGEPVLLLGRLFASPTAYAHILFALASELFLSALFLADYAREAGDEAVCRTYRRIAVSLGPAAMAAAILTTLTMVPEASWIVTGMRREWIWFALSVAAFVVGFIALFRRLPDGRLGYTRVAFVSVVVQYAIASFAYGRAHLPYIIYPHLTVEAGVTNPQMFRQLLIGYTVGTLILVPIFYWFWRLFMKDKRYLRQE